MSVVRYFILIVVKVKQRSERGHRFPFNSSDVKHILNVVCEEKERSERSQIFPFSSSDVKQRSECSQ